MPSHQVAAERRELGDLARRYSVPRDIHPLDGVMEQYHRLAGQVTFLEDAVNALPPEQLFFGVESETDRSGGEGGGGSETKRKAAPNAALVQLNQTQREYGKLGIEILRVGLEQVAQARTGSIGTQLAGVIQALLADIAAMVVARPELAGSEQALLGALQPLAVERITAFAGVSSPRTIDGSAA